MTLFITLSFFILGTIIGSFLNVVIFRFNTERTFGGRSGCMVCKHTLSWQELVPIFSFLFLKGRCKNCQTKISIQYPIVEFITGMLFMTVFLKYRDIFFLDTIKFSISYAYYVVMFSILLIIAVYDLKHKIIPDKLSLIFGILAFVGLFFFKNYIFEINFPSIPQLFSGVFLALPFLLLWLISRGASMGFGDVKLALGLGWLLGISRMFSGVVVSFWSGAIIGIFLIMFSKKYGVKSEIPFAPFLVFGFFLAFIFELQLFPI